MGNFPTIQAIHTIPQLTTAGQQTLVIGLEWDERPIVWSEPLPHNPQRDLASQQAAIRQLVAPQLVGQPLTAFRPLMEQINQLTETFTITEVTQPTEEIPAGTISRRRLISGLLAEDQPPAPVETVYTESRPLPSILCYALSTVLLRAVALAQQVSVRQILLTEFGGADEGEGKSFSPQLQAAVSDPAVATIVSELQAIWHTISGKNPAKQLGENNIRLQQYMRQLKDWLAQVTPTRPSICLDLGGSLGELYNKNIGKILGAVYGLENAVKPYPLVIIDPLIDDDPLAQRKRLGDLKKYFGFRKLKTQIWVRRIVKTVDEIQPLVDAGAIDGLQIEIAQWGSLDLVIEGLQCGRAAGLPRTLIYPPHITPAGETLLHEVVSVTRPDSLLHTDNIVPIYNAYKQRGASSSSRLQ